MRNCLEIFPDRNCHAILIPPFSDAFWPHIVGKSGFVWIYSEYFDVTNTVQTMVMNEMFGQEIPDFRCMARPLNVEVSVPVNEFIQFVIKPDVSGIWLAKSSKHQPQNLRMNDIKDDFLGRLMEMNHIDFVLELPCYGEPAVIWSNSTETLNTMKQKYLVHEEDGSFNL